MRSGAWLTPEYIFSHLDIAAKAFAVLVVAYLLGLWWIRPPRDKA